MVLFACGMRGNLPASNLASGAPGVFAFPRLGFILFLKRQITMAGQKPLFNVVLRDGDEWLIEAEWPDGSIEHVCTFKAQSDAAN